MIEYFKYYFMVFGMWVFYVRQGRKIKKATRLLELAKLILEARSVEDRFNARVDRLNIPADVKEKFKLKKPSRNGEAPISNS